MEKNFETHNTNSNVLDSYRTIKPSDFEINISGFSETKTINSVPKEKVSQKILNFKTLTNEKGLEMDVSFEVQEQIIMKKRASFNYMKKWDDYRKQLNSIYRAMIERIMNFLLEIGNSSLETYVSLLKFLKEKAQQEKTFGNPITDSLNWEKYKECEISKSLQELGLIEGFQRKDHLEFANFIDQELVQKFLSPNHLKYQSFFDHFKKLECKMRQNLNKMLMITREKFEEYAVVFAEVMRVYLTNGKPLNKDLLTFENFYLYAVMENYNLLKIYSKEMKEFWNCLKKIELERIKETEKIVSKFLEKEEELYQFFPFYQDQYMNIRNKLQGICPEKHIESLFDMNKILSSEQMQYLRQKHKIENCSEEVIFEYLEVFEVKPLNFRPIILGEMNVLEKDESISQKFSMKSSPLWKEIKILISVDLNMLVMGDTGDLSFKPEKIIKLPLCTCIYNDEICLATISEIKSTVLAMINVEKHYLKFKGSEELMKFKELIGKHIRTI